MHMKIFLYVKSYLFSLGINEYINKYDENQSGQLLPGSINVDEMFEETGSQNSELSRHIRHKYGPQKLSQIALSNSTRLYSLIVQV